jgi:hypothetical protein
VAPDGTLTATLVVLVLGAALLAAHCAVDAAIVICALATQLVAEAAGTAPAAEARAPGRYDLIPIGG